MSVTITQHPSSISFAGNPVLLKASSNLSGKTFLKVCAKVTVTLYLGSVKKSESEHPLSIPTEGGSSPVTFDLSDVLSSGLSQNPVERNIALAGGAATVTGGYVLYSVKVWDEYLDEYSEIVSTETTASVSSGARIAIPGKYTDMQRLTLSEDTASWLGGAKILSNKPDYEAVPVGGKITIPVFREADGTVSNTLDGTSDYGSHTFYGNSASWKTFVLPPAAVPGQHFIGWTGMGLRAVYIHVVPQPPFARYFEFVNRLGAVESIYTFGRAKRKASPSQERQVKRHNTSFKPTTRYVKRTLQEEQTWELSTGPVNREWAKWFSAEFFTAEQTWMYSDAAGDMVPVIIESDEDISIYDESAAEVIDLQFKVTMCINE